MDELTFRIRPYSKRELARLYFPDTLLDESAVANLRNLIKRNPELLEELKKAHYNPHNKILTPRQVSIIADFLGEP